MAAVCIGNFNLIVTRLGSYNGIAGVAGQWLSIKIPLIGNSAVTCKRIAIYADGYRCGRVVGGYQMVGNGGASVGIGGSYRVGIGIRRIKAIGRIAAAPGICYKARSCANLDTVARAEFGLVCTWR